MEEKSFAEFMAENPVEREWLHPGQRIDAVIVKITPEWIFIDLGGKSEGYLDSKEFLDEKGVLTVKEGDAVKAYFLSSKNNEKIFTTKVGKGDAAKSYLEDAFHNGIPVEGKIAREVKGGYEIIIAGDVRAFCPFSQMGLPRNENIAEYIGKNLSFIITEYKENGRNIILSRRRILDEEKNNRKNILKETLKEGMLIQGKIMSVQKFGAFVDIGGIQGLLPLSEIGWNRTVELDKIVNVGDELSLSIVKLDWDAEKITLSRKATLPDPWTEIEKKFIKGTVFTGQVSSLANFGAFVELEAGVEGLIHISQIGRGKKIKHAGEALSIGQAIEVRVESVDVEKKRISLSMVGSDVEEKKDLPDDYKKYLGTSSLSLGSLGDALRLKSSGLKEMTGSRKKK